MNNVDANPHQAIKSHVDEDDLQKLEAIDNLGRTQRANYINESGLYALILGSTKETAKRFKKWVTSEVLPAIRKTGATSNTMPASRVIMIDGEPWFVGKEIAEVLGYKDATTAIRSHCRGVQKLHPILDNLGRTQEAPQDGADATTMPASRVARQQHRADTGQTSKMLLHPPLHRHQAAPTKKKPRYYLCSGVSFAHAG